ncbi:MULTISPECIES: flagellar basal-body MS-ring/collar protein FliF [unclassified Beijerinckia]|uniref:flagellar basal-body MS-ring/collar protein FliF n=1 Tax=unclassified Beijerinckia TaxID=2638183 RepID=UPI000B86BEDD|nr:MULTISPECIES: flagellar basal-body MS-ring/collar protein FliF [unclassified Beijerinckia]
MEQLERLWGSLLGLGRRRLIALAMVGAAVFAATGLVGYQMSRPSFEVLYAGLDRQDVSRISRALTEATVGFDISSDGATVYVRYGETARARMLLAEKGLPHGASAGYELFDKVGSLGLTSFMQEVTRVRAAEGELARTIQFMRGVRAARVHIVMGDEGSFRRGRQTPSASVAIRTDATNDAAIAQAIRHLVAAAVPGMLTDQVTVIDSDGTLLSSTESEADAAPGRLHGLEKSVSKEIQDNVRKTLSPYLTPKNFQISVFTRLNTDKRQTSETVYNPESRVERSVRVIKENQQTQNSTSQQQPTSVDRNLPQQQPDRGKSGDNKQSNEENQKREELTNYEISSKTTSTVSGGYVIEAMSVAVVINRASLAGDGKVPAEQIAAKAAEIEQLVATASGARRDRGDTVKVSVVDFAASDRDLEPTPAHGVLDLLARYAGTLINSIGTLLAIVLVLVFGVRPAVRALMAVAEPAEEPMTPLLTNESGQMRIEDRTMPSPIQALGLPEPGPELMSQPIHAARARLEQIIALDETQSVAVLRQWMTHRVAA